MHKVSECAGQDPDASLGALDRILMLLQRCKQQHSCRLVGMLTMLLLSPDHPMAHAAPIAANLLCCSL